MTSNLITCPACSGVGYLEWQALEHIDLQARAEKAEAEVKRLREALVEAIEWNWMDDGVPLDVQRLVKEALEPEP